MEDGPDSLAELVSKVSLNTFEPGSWCRVEVTHVNDPHSFFVLPRDYKNHMEKLEGEGDPIDEASIRPGINVTFFSKKLKKFIRGRIISVIPQSGECNVFAVDYGFMVDNVPNGSIRKAKPGPPIAPLALHCKLADCKPIGDEFSKDAIEAMEYYSTADHARYNLHIHIKERGPQVTVELIHNDNVAMLLALTGLTTLGYVENTVNRFTTQPVEEKKEYTYLTQNFEPNDIVNVRIQSGKSLDQFYVANLKDYQKYLDEKPDFNYHCKRFGTPLKVEDLEFWKPVAVLTSLMKYERGLIKEVLGEMARVQLVDWGTILEVSFLKLKEIPKECFFTYPAIALYCSAQADSDPIKLLVGSEFSMKIIEVGDGLLKPHIVAKV